jgi:2-methylfumaryl-CoA isomerase
MSAPTKDNQLAMVQMVVEFVDRRGRPRVLDFGAKDEYLGPLTGEPVTNQVLPAWDLLVGMTGVTGVLAALHPRTLAGEGACICLALADVAVSGVGNLGLLAEAGLEGRGGRRHGNHAYGSFGVDFSSANKRCGVVVSLAGGHLPASRKVTVTARVDDVLASSLDAHLNGETDRYRLGETITDTLRPRFAVRTSDGASRDLDDARVLWGPYRSMPEAAQPPRQAPRSPAQETYPGVGTMLVSATTAQLDNEFLPSRSPLTLGADTEEVISEVQAFRQAEIGRSLAQGVVGPAASSARGSA